MTVNCTLQPDIGGKSLEFIMPADTIAEMLGEALDVPGIGVYLEGCEIRPGVWHVVTPKDGTHLTVTVPVHGGGGQKGGKNSLAVIASLVVAVGAIAISSGALAGPLGAAFLAGGTGAIAASAAVGLPGSVALAALKPASGTDQKTVNDWVGEKRQLAEFAQPPASRQHFDIWQFQTAA